MRKWEWSLLAFLSLIGGCLGQAQCGRDAGGALCPDGLCCSQYGYCGTTPDYCGDGCQSQCTPVDVPQCGRDAGGALCPDGLCCSQYGYCGNTPDYCGDGCQSQCTPVDTPQCGRDAGGVFCPNGLCCSQYGFCGNTPDYCGDSCQSQCTPVDTPECGRDAGGALCPNGDCCSQYGFCGTTAAYCTDGCQSQCTGGTPTPTPSGDLTSLIPQSLFNEMLKHRSDPNCQGGFYTYDAFIAAARSFGGFASEGDSNMRKREIAAFLAQTSHETTGGWASAPDGLYAWGYCFIQERGDNPGEYCSPDPTWPCAPNEKYFGRGPIQISWNYNYGPAGRAIGSDLLSNPDLVASDPTISFKTAFWFWMTTQSPKPSCHDVIVGRWTPSDADRAAGRLPGFGLTTNIINGGLECGHGPDDRVIDRIGFYWRYCDMLGVSPGDNLDCYNQRSYNLGNSHLQDELVKQS